MGVFAVVVVGIIVIVGLIEIVHEKIRESRRLDDVSLDGRGESQGNQTDDTHSSG